MSGRKLGGGRVLGSGKGLAPPPNAYASRPTSPLAPSDASSSSIARYNVGMSPPTPPSPLPGFAQDLTSNISLAAPTQASSTSQLVCPICEEEMLTLLQLNRHIDDVHQELPEIQQDEVKTWFDKQVLKAKRLTPISLINQKLRGLDVFEQNEYQPMPAAPAQHSTSLSRPTDHVLDPDELITRKHWQRSTGYDLCTEPACGKGLGSINGNINCRNCGRMFCEVHTMYQMKLSKAAKHDPVRGYWARVCETCYKSREGYNDHRGADADHTGDFVAMRQGRVERQNLEISRLEKRLTKLTRLLAEPPEELPQAGSRLSLIGGLTGQRDPRKAIEQTVVMWEDDASVPKCPFCKQEFGSWTFRRHHCRICGRVVCADPQTGCSSEVGLSVEKPSANEKPTLPDSATQISVDIRMCRDCKSTIFSKRDFDESIAHKPPDQRAYETLCQFERGIKQLMPSFQRALQSLQGEEIGKPPPTRAQIQDAARIRKRLMDSFAKYNLAARRVKDLKTDNPAQLRLQNAIWNTASTFLHANMVPLKHVPRMLKSQSSSSHRKLLNGSGGGGYGSPLRNGESASGSGGGGDASSLAGSEASTVVSALETEEKDLRERLVVLEEQRFLVQEMVSGARGSRRMEEATALSRNLDELDVEIEALRGRVSGVETRWEGVYNTSSSGGGGV